ncbi:hypothetical protein H4J59_06230, partial [Colwellia sp. MB02u-10]|uniref:putative Ig domain-containing protein n=1 Tax=Colwellia sp. MB02u-10 TaxID=2759828 RepID=UPI0015F650EC
VGTTSNIVLTVTDLANVSDSLNAFTITVTNVNDAPVISGTPATTIAEDTPYSFTATATDDDNGDILVYSITGAPNWLNINSATGVLSGTP